MLASLIIVFREVLEAGLIVGIVLAATRTVPGRGRWIGGGIVAGTLGACVVAGFAGGIANAFAGAGQEILNAGILGLAVLMLAWHNIWMSSHARDLSAQMYAVGDAIAAGSRPMYALAVVVGLAVLREGSEVVLFLYSIAAAEGGGTRAMIAGSGIGIVVGAGVAGLLYFGLLGIPTRYLFRVTGWLITLLAAGMASQAVAFLGQAGLVPPLIDTVWDTSWLLSDATLFGKTLHTLIGYTDRPSAMQLIAYVGTLLAIYLMMRRFSEAPARRAAA